LATELGVRGAAEVTLGGKGPMRRRRPNPVGERVAKRVKKLERTCRVDAPPGVVPLNCGFFQLERMRSVTVAKLKARRKAKARSK
jgi:hypothetical protein